jgi:hypothetical protein
MDLLQNFLKYLAVLAVAKLASYFLGVDFALTLAMIAVAAVVLEDI